MYTRRMSPGCHFDVGIDIVVSDKLNDGVEFISDLCPDFFRWSVVREGECDTESRVGSSDVGVGYGIFV